MTQTSIICIKNPKKNKKKQKKTKKTKKTKQKIYLGY